MKTLLRTSAAFYLLTWVVLSWVAFSREWGVLHGGAPTWTADDSAFRVFIAGAGLLTMLLSWVGSVYIWSKGANRGFAAWIVLGCLMLFGAVVSPFYVLKNARRLQEPRREGGAPVAA